METWQWFLALTTGGATLIGAASRLLGAHPINALLKIKNRLFDLGALMIRIETCEADRRALEEALARKRARDEMRSSGRYGRSPFGATSTSTATSGMPARRRPRTRSSSPPSEPGKPAKSPTDPTPT